MAVPPLAAPSRPTHTVVAPRTAPAPLVLDSPHSGSWYPDDFGHAVPARALRDGEDCYVDELFGHAPAVGATLLHAHFARTYIDPNRHPDDVDAELLDAPWPHPVSASGKATMGKALVWRTLSDGRPIYDRLLSPAELRHRIDHYLFPYQRALGALIDETRARHGVVYHVNCHSMGAVGGIGAPDEGRARADVVLGDRDGTTCEPSLVARVARVFADAGYSVRMNDPYKGVELVRAFSDPTAGRHSLQIELNRSRYMDEASLERHEGFARLRATIDALLVMLAGYARERAAAASGGARG